MHARGLQFILHDKDTNEDDFDSCMREDCNDLSCSLDADVAILIHACARIATQYHANDDREYVYILIHACARIATKSDGTKISNLYILIHACARIATQSSFWIPVEE